MAIEEKHSSLIRKEDVINDKTMFSYYAHELKVIFLSSYRPEKDLDLSGTLEERVKDASFRKKDTLQAIRTLFKCDKTFADRIFQSLQKQWLSENPIPNPVSTQVTQIHKQAIQTISQALKGANEMESLTIKLNNISANNPYREAIEKFKIHAIKSHSPMDVKSLSDTYQGLMSVVSAYMDFTTRHKALCQQNKWNIFAFYTRSELPADYGVNLETIMKQGQKENNYTRQVCAQLGWLTKEGNLTTHGKELLKQESMCLPQTSSLPISKAS